MTIFIDSDFKCHMSNENGQYTAVDTNFFDGKCDAYIEGYRFVPAGMKWTRSDGIVFEGRMTSPWKDFVELDGIQRVYERELIKQYEESLNQYETEIAELDAAMLEMQYQNLVEGL